MFKKGLFTAVAIIILIAVCTGCRTTREQTSIKRDTVTVYLNKEKEVELSTNKGIENLYQWGKDSIELVITEYTIKPDSVTPYVSKAIKVTREKRGNAIEKKERETQHSRHHEGTTTQLEEGKTETTRSTNTHTNAHTWFICLLCFIIGVITGYRFK